jgi:hypothetical protein
VALADDSTNTNAFPLFNLATIDAMNGEYKRAVEGFSKSIDNAPAFTDAFVTHLDLYFNKHYTITDSSLYRSFRDEAFVLDIQYLGYASILYCFIRDAHQLNDEKLVDQVFSRMFNFKDEDMLTWYHHACFDALKKNKVAALNSLEKSLKLGFGNYFMLTSDDDLAFIRNEPEFKEMLKRYFPDRPGKK